MLKGIDTSHFSGFSPAQLQTMVKANRLYFNFIKASEAATIQDARFVELWNMSRQAGLATGAYHFFRPLSDVAAQAQNFITQYKKVSRMGVLPPVVDLEWSPVAGVEQWNQVLPAQRIPKIKMFLSAIEEACNVKPIIYTAPAFWQEFITSQSTPADNSFFVEYPLWVVDLKNSGKLPAPWVNTTPAFKQTHFGEKATTTDPYDVLDQDLYTGDLKGFLNATMPGFTIMNGFPASFIVADLQAQLIAKGVLQGAADGQFGNHTEQAVKDFQTANGLFANGIIDAQTWNKLLA